MNLAKKVELCLVREQENCFLTALGAGVGSYLGGEIAEYLTEDEKVSLHNSIYGTAKNGELRKKTYLWKNNSDTVSTNNTLLLKYDSENGKCRKVNIKVLSGSDSESNKLHKVNFFNLILYENLLVLLLTFISLNFLTLVVHQ